MSRNKLLLVLLVASLLLGTISSAFAQGNVLTVWADGERSGVFLDVADDVEAELGIELNVVEIGFNDIRDQLLVAGPVGEGPDILVGAHDWLGLLVSNGALVPIELGDKAGDFVPSTLDALTFNSKLYGVPTNFENIALIRNTDLVPEAPQSIEEITQLAEDFAASEDSPQYAFLVQTGDPYHAHPIFTAFGGYIFGFNEDGSYNPADVGLNSEGGLAAAEWMETMYTNEYMVPNVGGDEVFALFEEGDLAMFVTGPWFSQRISEAGVPYSIDPFPASATVEEAVASPFSGVQGIMISNFSDNQLLAEIFLQEYVATLEFQQAIFDSAGRPPAFLGVDTSLDPNVEGFVNAGTTAVAMPAIPEMGAVWGAAGDAQTLVSQGEDATQTYNNAVVQINEAIQLVQSEERIIGLPGSFQSLVGCDGDWQPACEATFLALQDDGTYSITLEIPAGDYEYKIAMNGGWDENYGVEGEADGANYTLSLAEDATVTFTYDDETNVVVADVE
jgi:arabinogalactan oligomer / maltooligosaccharide transport system substrate-binding protein